MAPLATAEGLARDIVDCCKGVDDLSQPAKDAVSKAAAACNSNNKEEALQLALQALALVSSIFMNDDLKKVRDKAMKSVQQAVTHLKEADNCLGEAHAMCALAKLTLSKNRPDGAIKESTQAADLFQQVGNKKGMAQALSTAVDAHLLKAKFVIEGKGVRMNAMLKKTPTEIQEELKARQKGHFEDAATQAREVIEYFRQGRDQRGQADMMVALADISNASADYEQAKEVAQMARDIYSDLGDNKGQQTALQMEINAHVESMDGNEALNTAQEIIRVYRKANDKMGEAEGMFEVMKILYLQGDISEMMKMGTDARGLLAKSKDARLEGQILDLIMRAQVSEEKNDEAIKTTREAIDVYRMHNDKHGEAIALHACCTMILDKFFKETKENHALFKKMGFNDEFFKEVDMPAYEEAVGMLNKATDYFRALKDKAALDMALETQRQVMIKTMMMNDPDETKNIVKDRKLVEQIQTWNLPDDPAEVPAIAGSA